MLVTEQVLLSTLSALCEVYLVHQLYYQLFHEMLKDFRPSCGHVLQESNANHSSFLLSFARVTTLVNLVFEAFDFFQVLNDFKLLKEVMKMAFLQRC